MILVDTGAWFALTVREDPDHAAAVRFSSDNTEPLLTTDLVIVETMTLLRYRDRKRTGIASEVGDDLWEGRAAQLHLTTAEDIRRAREIFRTYDDKSFSFTDCASFAVMERLHLHRAFSFDAHFDQYPGIQRVPL